MMGNAEFVSSTVVGSFFVRIPEADLPEAYQKTHKLTCLNIGSLIAPSSLAPQTNKTEFEPDRPQTMELCT